MAVAKRGARFTLFSALVATAVLNYDLFLSLVIPVSQLLVLPMSVGLPIFAGVIATNYHRVVEATKKTPWAPTPVEDFLAHIEAADIDFADPKILDNQGSKETILLELGSGDGRILLAARRRAGFTHALGLEKNPVMAYISKLRIFLEGCDPEECDVHVGDAHRAQLPRAIPLAVYVYLSEEAMKGVARRLACLYPAKRDNIPMLRPTILSRDFPMPGWGTPYKMVRRGASKLYVYKAAQFQPPCHHFEQYLANLTKAGKA